MAQESFYDIAGQVQGICPAADPELARLWVQHAWRELCEHRDWSWLMKRDKFYLPASYSTGTIAATQGSTDIVGTATVWTSAMVGRQLLWGDGHIYTIASVASNTALTLDKAWASDDVSGASYEIALMYVTPPSDFYRFKSVLAPDYARQLVLGTTQEEIDGYDPRRSSATIPCTLSGVDFTESYSGTVAPTLQALGSGAKPTSSGTYTGADDAIFTVEITTTGVVGAADFRWKKGEGSYTSGVVTAASNTLQEGVVVGFGAGSFTDGDIFVIRCSVVAAPGLPRYEVYPRASYAMVLPYYYVARPADLSDSVALPRYIQSHVILEGALMRAAAWPGSVDRPNAYAQIDRRNYHLARFKEGIYQLEQQDNNIIEQNVTRELMLPYASLPWGGMLNNYSQDTDYGWRV